MAAVTFTKNVTAKNRDAGLFWLKFYYNQSPLAQFPYYPVTNYPGLVAFLDTNYKTYIEFLGETSFMMSADKMQASMRDLAYNGKKSYPRPSDFSVAILKNAGLDLSDVVKATTDAFAESAVTIGEGIVSYSKMIPYIVGGALFLVIFLKLGGGSAVAQNFRRANPRKRRK
jgi:hypothetical protein